MQRVQKRVELINNVGLQLISKLDFMWFQKFLPVILLNKERHRKSLIRKA